MGCSSSSAENVDQEKRPATKPEESNGDTVAVRNGVIAETIQDQTLLPACALADDLQLEADDGENAVLMAIEAEEDLGSGEELLALPQPQPEPFNVEERDLVAGIEEEEAATVVEEEHVMVESLCEASVEIPAVEGVDMEQAVEDVKEMKAGVHAETGKTDAPEIESVEEELKSQVEVVEPVQAVEQTIPSETSPEEPPVKPVVPVTQESVIDVPADKPSPFDVSMDSSLQLPTSEIPVGTPVSHEVAPSKTIPSEASTTESSAPSESVEAVIHTGIAVASIPEMPPSFEVTDDTKAEQQHGNEEHNKALMMPSENSTQAETTNATFDQRPAAVAEKTDLKVLVSSPLLSETKTKDILKDEPTSETSPCSGQSDAAVEVPAPEPTQTDSEATLAPVAAGQVCKSLSEGKGPSPE
ncbi:cell surface glycoprotein 1-like [Entelurus aequoreus]|uniref:cell surface glycoprotein 1-like n=1 Tax=Entelurus aequoreus TaxID=161455 RepID=UPI002B1E0A70|nr:cell surface glycoprotein 1-like [Entelurus aequoreus]